jgi:hypothetical protein
MAGTDSLKREKETAVKLADDLKREKERLTKELDELKKTSSRVNTHSSLFLCIIISAISWGLTCACLLAWMAVQGASDKAERDRLARENEDLIRDKERIQRELDAKKREVEDATRQRDATKSDLEKKLAELTDKVESVKRAKRSLKDQLQALQENRGGRDSRGGQGKDSAAKEEELRRKIEDIKRERDGAKADADNLRKEKEAKDRELRKLRDEKDDAARKVQDLERRQREADQRAQDLGAKLAALEANGSLSSSRKPSVAATAGADVELKQEVERLKAELEKAKKSKDGDVCFTPLHAAACALARVLTYSNPPNTGFGFGLWFGLGLGQRLGQRLGGRRRGRRWQEGQKAEAQGGRAQDGGEAHPPGRRPFASRCALVHSPRSFFFPLSLEY